MSKLHTPAPLPETKKLALANGTSGLIAWDVDMTIPLTAFTQAGLEFQDKTSRSPPPPDISKVFAMPTLFPQDPVPPSDLAADFTPPKKTPKSSTTSSKATKTPRDSTVLSAPAPCYEFERDTTGTRLSSAGLKSYAAATAAWETKRDKHIDSRSACITFVLACLTPATITAVQNHPNIKRVLGDFDLIGLRLIIESILLPTSSTRSIDSLSAIINLKQGDHSTSVESYFSAFTQCSDDVHTVFGSVDHPGFIKTSDLLKALFLNGVHKDYKPWFDHVTTTSTDLDVQALIDSLRQFDQRERAYSKRNGGDDPDRPAGGTAKANKAAAILSLVTSSASDNPQPIKYPKHDNDFRTPTHPHSRHPGNHTGPAKPDDPDVIANGCCTWCYRNGWIVTNHPTFKCIDFVWYCEDKKLPAPTAVTHPNLRLGVPAALSAPPVPPVDPAPPPTVAATAPHPISAINTVASQSHRAHALLSTLACDNRASALACIADR